MPAIFLSLLFNKYTIGALLVAGLLLGAYWKGYSTASARCHDAELRAVIASQARDIQANEDAAKTAADLQSQLASDNIELQQTVSDYEKELASRPDAKCALSPADVDRLRGIGGK